MDVSRFERHDGGFRVLDLTAQLAFRSNEAVTMRVHPISLALQYLRGRRSFHGPTPFDSVEGAVATLRRLTGQDFGHDAKAWGTWLRENRAAYSWQGPPGRG